MKLKDRIRGYLPVVIDVETSGFNEQNGRSLGNLCNYSWAWMKRVLFLPKTTLHYHVEPFKGREY
jgi:ribonuclease T